MEVDNATLKNCYKNQLPFTSKIIKEGRNIVDKYIPMQFQFQLHSNAVIFNYSKLYSNTIFCFSELNFLTTVHNLSQNLKYSNCKCNHFVQCFFLKN